MSKPNDTNVKCGTPVRIWSTKRFCWAYYPFQCGREDCGFCNQYKQKQKEKRILEIQAKLPESSTFVYKLSSQSLANNLIKRIKRRDMHYVRLSGDNIYYIVSDHKDDLVRNQDVSPQALIESIVNQWSSLRITNAKTVEEQTAVNYSVSKIISNAPKVVRDEIFLLCHLLIPEIESLPPEVILERVAQAEKQILTVSGYQTREQEPKEKTSNIKNILGGIENNITKAKLIIQKDEIDIIDVIKYVKNHAAYKKPKDYRG